MAIFLAACCGGILPGLFFATMVYALDRYEREPWYLVLMTFLWGAIPAIILALVIQLPFGLLFPDEPLEAIVVAPVTEEFFKGLVVGIIAVVMRREFDSITDGIVYGAMVGFGFSVTENILYLAGTGFEQGLGALAVLFVLRTLIFGLNHAFFTSLTGIGLAWSRLSRGAAGRWLAPVLGLAAAMIMHGLHNAGAQFTSEENLAPLGLSLVSDWMGVIGVLVVMLVALRGERRWMTTYLPEEVTLGVLNRAQYEDALSAVRRTGQVVGALARGDVGTWRRRRRFYSLCSELAQKKYQCAVLGEHYQPDVDRLRSELAALSTSAA